MFSIRNGVAGLFRASLTRTYATESTAFRGSKDKHPSEVTAALARASSLFKTYKPVSPGIRHLKRPLNPHLYEGRPVRHLTFAQRKTGGRNHHGIITCRHRGGGHRRRIRVIDFKREEPGVHDIVRIEYDPGRSAHIALLKSQNPNVDPLKKWSYILASEGMRAGDTVQSFRKGVPDKFIPGYNDSSPNERRKEAKEKLHAAIKRAQDEARAKRIRSGKGTNGAANLKTEVEQDYEAALQKRRDEENVSAGSLAIGLLRSLTIKPGNVLPLRLLPIGTIIHNISLHPDGPGILVRSAGSFGQVVAHDAHGIYVQVRLQSGEVRKILSECCATIGKVSNPLWKNRNLGKAGRSRWLGRRPSVRGVAMNANDHPHGGGRGKSKSDKHPVSIWGWNTKGKRTRKPGPNGPKNSNKMVVRERPRGKEKRAS